MNQVRPRIRIDCYLPQSDGTLKRVWRCESLLTLGCGYTPRQAFEDWQSKRTWSQHWKPQEKPTC